MNSNDHVISRLKYVPVFTSKKIVLPLELILLLADYLKFEDFRNFIRSLWPNRNEVDIIRNKLWKMSTNKIVTAFINGQLLEIEYNYDSSRKEEDQVLINVDSLLPVFGKVVSLTGKQFFSASNLKNFVAVYVHMDLCSSGAYASCPCHLNVDSQCAATFVKPESDMCKYGHFHHFCSRHVDYWLSCFLDPMIMRLQSGLPYDGEDQNQFLAFIASTIYFRGSSMCFRDSQLYKIF